MLFGCNTSNSSDDSTFKKTNVSPEFEIYSAFERDEQQFYIVGNNKENTIYYEAHKNDIMNWKLQNLDSIKGKNRLFYVEDEKFFFVNKTDRKIWDIFSVDKKNMQINHIDSYKDCVIKFFKKEHGSFNYSIIINKYIEGSLHSKGDKLMKITSKGETIIHSLNENVQNPIYKEGSVYFIGIPNKLFKVNISSFHSSFIQYKDMKILDFKITGVNSYFILGELNGKTILMKYENGKWEEEERFFHKNKNYRGSKLHLYNDFIGVLTYKVDDKILYGLGGTNYRLIVSKNKGVNWEIVNLPIDTFTQPSLFYQNKKFICYSGNGKITIIDFPAGGRTVPPVVLVQCH